MIQVEWNKEHTWKITKKYVNGKLDSFKYQGLWYVPVNDYSGIETDAFGNCYIGSDCCDNCPLEKIVSLLIQSMRRAKSLINFV